MCATFSFYSPSRLPRRRAVCWSVALWALPNSLGFKSAKMEDGPSQSSICWLETEKAAGTQCLADRLRLSQATWAGLLNDTYALASWYDWVFSGVEAKREVSVFIPDLTLWKMLWVPVRLVVAVCFLAGWGGFVPRVIKNLYTGVTLQFLVCSDIKQQRRRKYFWWPSFTRVESRCIFYSMQFCCRASWFSAKRLVSVLIYLLTWIRMINLYQELVCTCSPQREII